MGEHGDSFAVRNRELGETILWTIAEDLFEYEPDGSPDLAG